MGWDTLVVDAGKLIKVRPDARVEPTTKRVGKLHLTIHPMNAIFCGEGNDWVSLIVVDA